MTLRRTMCDERLVEEQLEAAEIDLIDQGASAEHVEDELACLRQIFAEHREREIAEAMRWLVHNDATVH